MHCPRLLSGSGPRIVDAIVLADNELADQVSVAAATSITGHAYHRR